MTSQLLLAIATGSIASLLILNGANAETVGQRAKELGVDDLFLKGELKPWSPGGDVTGDLGYPLNISGPTFPCPTGWHARMTVDSGQLPPGLALKDDGGISGIPTERGHWIVTMKVENIMCNGHHYTALGLPEVFVERAGPSFQGVVGVGTQDTCMSNEGQSDWRSYCSTQTIRFHIGGSGEVH